MEGGGYGAFNYEELVFCGETLLAAGIHTMEGLEMNNLEKQKSLSMTLKGAGRRKTPYGVAAA